MPVQFAGNRPTFMVITSPFYSCITPQDHSGEELSEERKAYLRDHQREVRRAYKEKKSLARMGSA